MLCHFAGIIRSQYIREGMIGSVPFVRMSTVRLLTFFAPYSDPRYPTCSEFAFGSRTCFTLATTESALNGSPSVNLTPGRS